LIVLVGFSSFSATVASARGGVALYAVGESNLLLDQDGSLMLTRYNALASITNCTSLSCS